MKTINACIYLLILFWASNDTFACSSFCLYEKEHMIVGKNYDWHQEEGYLLKNNRGIEKTAFLPQNLNPITWTAKHGSITFNQYGKEFPVGGMNEVGLVIETLWLNETVYPINPRKPGLNELEWVQYQLDNFHKVGEVIRALEAMVIIPVAGQVHYFVADEYGQSAVIEFINGEVIVNRQSGHYQNITNNTYKESEAYTKKKFFKTSPTCSKSLCRYSRAKNSLSHLASNGVLNDENRVDKAFDILGNVKIAGYTKWTIVYDVTNRVIHYYVDTDRKRKTISFCDFIFAQDSPSLGLKMNNNLSGKVNAVFKPYTETLNLELIQQTAPDDIPIDLNVLSRHQIKPEINY